MNAAPGTDAVTARLTWPAAPVLDPVTKGTIWSICGIFDSARTSASVSGLAGGRGELGHHGDAVRDRRHRRIDRVGQALAERGQQDDRGHRWCAASSWTTRCC